MTQVGPEAEVEEVGPAVRVSAVSGAVPLGAVFGGIGLLAATVVGFLHVDRIPFTFCVMKGLSGLPCPTCGSTRAFGRLFDLDLAGALVMNPFTTLVAVLIAGWALADLALLPSRRALRVGLSPSAGRAVRLAALFAFLANWIYLLSVGR